MSQCSALSFNREHYQVLVLKDLTNFLPKHFSNIWSLFLWKIGFRNFYGNMSLQKATRFSIYLQSNRLCSSKMHCFKCYSIPTPTFVGHLSFTRYE